MIRCERLGKRYGRRWLFRNLDLEIAPGDCLVITGSNGSGKSTLLKILAGVAPSTEGKCVRPADRRTGVGFAALDQAVYPVLTVTEHLELAAELRCCEARSGELLEEVGLAYAGDVLGAHLSTGMRARLKFALAIQANPAVLLMDEPSAGLDDRGREVVEKIVTSRQAKTAIVIATNDPQEHRFATHELNLVS